MEGIQQLIRIIEVGLASYFFILPWIGLITCTVLFLQWRKDLQAKRLSKIGLYGTLPAALAVVAIFTHQISRGTGGVFFVTLSLVLFFKPLAWLVAGFSLSAATALVNRANVTKTIPWPWAGHLLLALIAATYVGLFFYLRQPLPKNCAELPLGC